MMDSKKGLPFSTEGSPSRAVSPMSSVFRPRSTSGRSSPQMWSRRSLAEATIDDNMLRGLGTNISSEPISCVTRQTLDEDCARHRFIVWAAVKRNSSKRMKPEDKLRCPLVGCYRQFPGHESMLTHLAECERLPSGQYWCYDHERVERFDDMKCKHCLGHPSKRRKVISMAKQFFHSLGHKSKRGQNMASYPEDPSLPPPSYDSISLAPHKLDATELPTNQIVEADSREIWTMPTHMSADVPAINPQALLAPSAPELGCTSQQPALFGGMWDHTETAQASSMEWNTSGNIDMYNTLARPSLQLNTFGLQGAGQLAPPKPVPVSARSKHLSPSSSLRSNASANSNVSSGTSLISPASNASNWSGAWSMGSGFNTGVTSPVDDILADNPFKRTASGRSNVSSEPNYLHHFYAELAADVPDTRGTGDISPDPLLFSFNNTPSINPPYAGDLMFDLDQDLVDLGLGDDSASSPEVSCSETHSMAVSAYDALKAHLDESTQKIQHSGQDQLADQLRSMCTQSVAVAGLRTLRALLNGGRPTSAMDALCFIHLAYAFSMVTFEQHTVELSVHHFLQSLSYANDIPPIDQTLYQRLVRLIWQPPNPFKDLRITGKSLVALGKAPESKSGGLIKLEGDTLLGVAMSFLDKFEISLVLGQTPTSPEESKSLLYCRHLFDGDHNMMKTPFPFATGTMIQQLQQDYSDVAGLSEGLMALQRRVNEGQFISIRRLEIELMKAGTKCMNPLRYYGEYLPDIRRLCNPIYSNHNSGTSQPRLTFHNDAVALIGDMMAASGTPHETMTTSDEPEDIDMFIEQFSSDGYHQPQGQPVPEAGPSKAMAALGAFGMGFFGTNVEDDNNIQSTGLTTTDPFASVTSSVPKFDAPTRAQPPRQPSTSSSPKPPQPPSHTEPPSQTEQPPPPQCTLCDYRPQGDPKWFRGSMAKHVKHAHSGEPPQMYRCPFPGCTSAYRNRPDNLRAHQFEKNHFVGGVPGGEREREGRERGNGGKGSRKRKKTARDVEGE